MFLNPVLSTIALEPPISPNKILTCTPPQMGCRITVYTNLGFALDGNPNAHLYLVLRHYPLGLDLFSCRAPLLPRADRLTRSPSPATRVTTPLIVSSTSGKARLCPLVPLGLLAPENLLLVLTNETRSILLNLYVCIFLTE